VRGLTDEGGQLTDTYTYTAFGELVEHAGGDPQPYAFAGEPLDPNSGFQYHRARWLDPRPGRFISSDPFEGKPFDPASLHRYTYAANDAVGKRDPSGRFFLMDVSIANSIRSTLAGMQANFGFALIAQISEGGSAGLRELVLGAAGGLLLTGAVIFAARLFARLARFGRAVATASKVGKAGEAFDDLAELRRGLGLPAAGSADDGATLARLEIGGDKFYGINAHGQPVTLKVNAISKTHAETDAFQQAFNAGAGGGKARLVVDRDLCAACGQNGAVKSLARQLGVTELEVVTPGGTQVITP
jgi:RHS repeat-associated protein